MSVQKRKILTLKDKIDILVDVDNAKKRKVDIASEYGIPASSLSTIISQREKLQVQWSQTSGDSELKRIKKVTSDDLEQALLLWFTQQRSKNVPVNGPLLATKAKQFAESLGMKEFKGSNGYIEKFQRRHGLVFKAMCGESTSADSPAAESWVKNILPSYLHRYSPEDVYNADETSLFYELLPSHTLAFKGETCSGGKKSKVRLTVLVCANMSGTDKRKLLVIGKSQNPRCFKGWKKSQLPVD